MQTTQCAVTKLFLFSGSFLAQFRLFMLTLFTSHWRDVVFKFTCDWPYSNIAIEKGQDIFFYPFYNSWLPFYTEVISLSWPLAKCFCGQVSAGLRTVSCCNFFSLILTLFILTSCWSWVRHRILFFRIICYRNLKVWSSFFLLNKSHFSFLGT